jgi:hypothetical protein
MLLVLCFIYKQHTMNRTGVLVNEVGNARDLYIKAITHITEQQAAYRPAPGVWNVVEITEHLYWAEHGGIAGMWKTLYAIRNNSLPRQYESVHKNMTVEEIIAATWKEKELVPPVAAPRMGGTLAFWITALSSLQNILTGFGNDLQDEELRLLAHPHPISGDMDFHQRLEFLRFHINRHAKQVLSVLSPQNGLSS